ncbi:MAG: hypothetical protein COV76_04805 [Candidatus Omnitrophica bacterium CG11_big_fil_rev_8_21_14_0_20_64_10]|nr:MAG: hypothetical protein COV76_04805 [Candidatus Omnitrophica bacterium CG11_big_fil_rev_8_21_14_0_20_64_10]
MRVFLRVFPLFLSLLLSAGVARADELHLENGDRLTGRILSESPERVVLETEALGKVSVLRDHLKRVVRVSPPPAADSAGEKPKDPEAKVRERLAWTQREWKGQAALGADLSRGNTDKTSLSGRFGLGGKTGADEWTAKAEAAFGESDDATDVQRADGSLRYAFSFWERLAWYNFYTVQGMHDRFANVNWRLSPVAGVGYWWSDEPPLKWMGEIGAGIERTEFRGGTPRRTAATLMTRGWVEADLWGDAKLTQELTLWPRFGDGQSGEFRLKSETKFSDPIWERLKINLRLIDEYDSEPAGDAKRNDLRLISDLSWDF